MIQQILCVIVFDIYSLSCKVVIDEIVMDFDLKLEEIKIVDNRKP